MTSCTHFGVSARSIWTSSKYPVFQSELKSRSTTSGSYRSFWRLNRRDSTDSLGIRRLPITWGWQRVSTPWDDGGALAVPGAVCADKEEAASTATTKRYAA